MWKSASSDRPHGAARRPTEDSAAAAPSEGALRPPDRRTTAIRPWRDRLAPILAAGLCVVGVAGTAAAQDSLRRGPVVLDRPSPEFDPLGIRAGSFLIFPELAVTAGYNSNLFADPDVVVGDQFVETRPALRVRSQWSRHELDLDLDGAFRRHLSETTEDRDDGSLRVGGQVDVTRALRVNARLLVARETEDRGTVNDEGLIESPRSLNRLEGSLEVARDFDQLRIGLTAAAFRRNFLSEEDADRDRTDYRVIPRLEYEASPSLRLFTATQLEARRFDTVVDTNLDSVNYGFDLGTVFDINDLITGLVQVGVARTDFDDAALVDQTNLTTLGQVIWVPTPLSTVRLNFERSVIPTSVADSGSRTRTAARILVEHDLRRNLTLALEADYRIDDFEQETADDEFSDNRLNLGAAAEWRFNRWLGMEVAYEFADRSSTDPSREFTRNQVFIRLNLQR